jgi:hypothetical protein
VRAAGYWARLPKKFRPPRPGARTRRTPERPCLNCGDPVVGNYCPTCGQKKVEVRVSLREMVMEVVGDEMALSSALPRTLIGLLFRPGFLTREYVQGRCVRYILPLRLYIVTSIVFFLALSIVANPERWDLFGSAADEVAGATTRPQDGEAAQADAGETSDAGDAAVAGEAAVPGETSDAGEGGGAGEAGHFRLNIVNLGDTTRLPQWSRPIARHIAEQERRLESMPPREALGMLIRGLEENAPKAMFVLLPLFAGVLKLLYIRRRRFYVEHFVFALHVHAMVYLLFLFMLVTPWNWLAAVLIPWIFVYVFLAMKRVYGQGLIRTALKYALLGWAYFFLLMIGFTLTAVVTALTV